jgi:serine/threonine-protein kinase
MENPPSGNPRRGPLVGDKYQLLRLLGSGGMGEVHEARNTWTGRRVAIKFLRPELTASTEAVARFTQEARAATAIAHPHIVEVLDMGRDAADGALYIVQELLEGTTLRQHLRDRGGRISPEAALDIAVPIIGALMAAHAHGIVHRDVKPENILLLDTASGRPHPKLIDFGVAKVVGQAAEHHTSTGVAIGTPRYMSPEQLRGDRGIDGRADVWAMGVVLHEMLSGRCPFAGNTVYEVVSQLIRGRAAPLRTLAPELTPELAGAIDGAFAVELDERPASMQAFLDALLACPPLPGQAPGPPLAERHREAITPRPLRPDSPGDDRPAARLPAGGSVERSLGEGATLLPGSPSPASPAPAPATPPSQASGPGGSADDAFLRALARAPERPPGDPPPARLGHFQVGEPLGRGGMGVVYRALDERLGRTVALKLLPRAFEDDPTRRRRFLREARAAAAVGHPNLVTVFEIDEADGRIFIAMELVAGSSLRQRLAGGPLPEDEALQIFRQLLAGVAAAHRQGIVHRDLKPDNVMLGDGGTVKVLDFGLAKLPPGAVPESVAIRTAEGAVAGTPGYMSPEQLAGVPSAVDARSDVFALGVMLNELVTGRRPASPAGPTPGLPARLAAVLERCLASDPAQRFADAGQLAAALEQHQRRPGRPRRWLVTAGGGALLLGALTAAWMLYGPRRAPDPVHVPSADARAEATYAEALRLDRAGRSAEATFRKAAELDARFGAPRVRLALMAAFNYVARAKEPFQQAMALRDRLSPHDRALLESLEPIYQRQPADYVAALAASSRAVEAFPRSAEVRGLRANALFLLGRLPEAIETQKQAAALDPDHGGLLQGLGWISAYTGDVEGARRYSLQCLDRAPSAVGCLTTLIALDTEAGDCAAAEARVRRLLTIGPEFGGPLILADVLASQGKPLASVQEALRSAAGDFMLPSMNVADLRIFLSILGGDFAAAEQALGAKAKALASDRSESAHGWYAALQVELAAESGQLEEARRIAEDFLARREGWEPDQLGDDWALDRDPTALLVRVLQQSGALPAEKARALLDARHDHWRTRVIPMAQSYLWPNMYARGAADAAGAAWAVERLGQGQIPRFNWLVPMAARVGVAFAQAGQTDRALPYLERAVRTCDLLTHSFEQMRARLALGQAREQKGDRAAACAAYASVIERWGQARPRSITAEAARARAASLGCR